MLPLLVTICSFIYLLSLFTVIVNTGLVYDIFVSRKLKRQSTLTLFYIRFLIDILLATMWACYISSYLIKAVAPDKDLDPYQLVIFSMNLITSCTMSVRAVLVVIINFDRVSALFMPVLYHNYRKSVPNSILIGSLLCIPIWHNIVLWVICDYHFETSPGCIDVICWLDSCSRIYRYSFERYSHMIIAVTSLALALKLFVWNNCASETKSKHIERANYLALTDAAIIILFDIIPTFFVELFHNHMTYVFSTFALFRVGGYALDAFLARRELRRKNKVETNNGS